MQRATGMNITKHIKSIMEEVQKHKKDTDTGRVGALRSGVKGMVKQVDIVIGPLRARSLYSPG